MMPMNLLIFASLALSLSSTNTSQTAAQRGYQALTQQAFVPAAWREPAYGQVWKRWPGVTAKPADYDAAFREHYGLPAANFANGPYPMGLRSSTLFFVKGVTVDCLVCHGGSMLGKSYIGLGNANLDIQALFEDLSVADGRSPQLPFRFSNVRGTSEAGSMAIYLHGFREQDLKVKLRRKELGLHDNMCEDTPAWWLLKKKKTMYQTGEMDARSVRSKMQFMMTPLTSAAEFKKQEPIFRDIHEYLMTIEAPKYPFAINRELATKGEILFKANCASCHGSYGEKWTYPNKVIPIDEIGTDPNRYRGFEKRYADHYDRGWFAKENPGWFLDDYRAIPSVGYQAPPLDGIWATAPYFHNGSVPTLYQVLKSSSRPDRYTRSFRTDKEDYDPKRVGWIYTDVLLPPDRKASPYEQRKIYDTSLPGRSNKGHTYGDDLMEEERWSLIEYLKTL
jgi:hypothetical protein